MTKRPWAATRPTSGDSSSPRESSRDANKRPRLSHHYNTTDPTTTLPPLVDRLSALSDELLIRILAFLNVPNLLRFHLVSRRLGRLACDSQLWKANFYLRFVLPRALRIPGFRVAADHRLHYAGIHTPRSHTHHPGAGRHRTEEEPHERVDWKGHFKTRHNWARGKCVVEELHLGDASTVGNGNPQHKILVKCVDGIALTVDVTAGLRAWDLKTRRLMAQASISVAAQKRGNGDSQVTADSSAPTCIAVDDQCLDKGTLSITLGFLDGGFGIWRLCVSQDEAHLAAEYRHEKSSNGPLMAVAYSHPFILTSTESLLVSLYTFDHTPDTNCYPSEETCPRKWKPPYILSSLKSHSSTSPVALSIRKAGATTIATIAYTFTTHQGWSIGMQSLHIDTSEAKDKISSTRLAYSSPVPLRTLRRSLVPPRLGAGGRGTGPPATAPDPGPVSICYAHPYLLATLRDNTMLLYLCTSSATSLAISPGIRLWGHTSGISDAEITPRGRAVTVSTRGKEMRVWELEGGKRVCDSVEVRAVRNGDDEDFDGGDRRNWVGFDDEMVIVLKEKADGSDSLMVYDFT